MKRRIESTPPLGLLAIAAALLLLGGSASPALAQVAPDSTDAKAIMKAVEESVEGDKVKSRITMTITDRAGRTRTRVVKSRSLLFEGGAKQIMVFESPADVQGTGLLSVDYDDGAKNDDQWLYLPSLHKSTRISSSGRSGSFMGTDFSYSDMTQADPSHYDYKILVPSVKVEGEDCWQIEARPITDKAKTETGYLKSQIWVSKAKLKPLQIKSWVRAGKKLKYITFKDYKKVGGIWAPHKLTARTKRGKTIQSTTVISFSELSYGNAEVTDEIFSQRQLEKGL